MSQAEKAHESNLKTHGNRFRAWLKFGELSFKFFKNEQHRLLARFNIEPKHRIATDVIGRHWTAILTRSSTISGSAAPLWTRSIRTLPACWISSGAATRCPGCPVQRLALAGQGRGCSRKGLGRTVKADAAGVAGVAEVTRGTILK